jgi:hypothetical protein
MWVPNQTSLGFFWNIQSIEVWNSYSVPWTGCKLKEEVSECPFDLWLSALFSLSLPELAEPNLLNPKNPG